MELNAQPTRVTIFGGSGFLGRHVVRVLAGAGCQVRVACRRPDLAGHLQPLGNVGQIQLVQANLRYRWSIDRAVEDADVVINLAAILAPSGKQTFDAVHVRGAQWVAEAAQAAKARMVHISAIGADATSSVEYARTKGEAEDLVRKAAPTAIIMRPSIMFGAEDAFFNRFAAMACLSPVLPQIGGGHSMFDFVHVGDVARAVSAAALGRAEEGTVWELGGPERLSMREAMERMLETIGRKRLMMTIPFPIAHSAALVLQFLPGAPLTPGQVAMLREDNIVSEEAAANRRTLADLGIQPSSLASVLPSYLVRFRKHGQFEARRGL